MAMLKKRLMIKAMLSEMDKMAAYITRIAKDSVEHEFITQMYYLTVKFSLYDNIIERMKIGRVI